MLNSKKLEQVAHLIEGKVVADAPVPIFIRGTVLGFTAILEALAAGWPFGVTYIVETNVVDDPSRLPEPTKLSMVIIHRSARGPLKDLTRLLLMEPRGQAIGDKRVQERFLITCNNEEQGERFVSYPGVYEALVKLEKMTKFNEINVKANAGLSLSQPQSFNSLDLDACKETFRVLGELGQILFESFS